MPGTRPPATKEGIATARLFAEAEPLLALTQPPERAGGDGTLEHVGLDGQSGKFAHAAQLPGGFRRQILEAYEKHWNVRLRKPA
jgi:hypothetical protein